MGFVCWCLIQFMSEFFSHDFFQVIIAATLCFYNIQTFQACWRPYHAVDFWQAEIMLFTISSRNVTEDLFSFF